MNPQPLSSWTLYFDSFFIWLDWFSRHSFYLPKGPIDTVFFWPFESLMISPCCFHTQRTTWLEIQILGDPFLSSGFPDVTPCSLLELMTSEPTLDTGTLWLHTAPWFPFSGASLTEATPWPAQISWSPLLPFRRWIRPTSSGASIPSPLLCARCRATYSLKMTAGTDAPSSPTALLPHPGNLVTTLPSPHSLPTGSRRHRAIASPRFFQSPFCLMSHSGCVIE